MLFGEIWSEIYQKQDLSLNTSLAAPGALAQRLERRTACQWAPKWPTGSGVLGRSRQLLLNKFFDPSTPSMRKVDDGEEKRKKKKERKRKE